MRRGAGVSGMRSLSVRGGHERRRVGDELEAARASQEGDASSVSGARSEGASLYRAGDAPFRAGLCARGSRGAVARNGVPAHVGEDIELKISCGGVERAVDVERELLGDARGALLKDRGVHARGAL